MRSCPQLEERLNDYLDGELPPTIRAQVERHLEECSGCGAELSAMRSLREQTETLPRDFPPSRDLWPAIRKSLPAQRGGATARIPGSSVWNGPFRLSYAGALALLLIAFAIVVLVRQATPVSPDPRRAAASGPSLALDSVRRVEAEYAGAAEELQTALKMRGTGSPDLRILEENVEIVDRAIREVHRAAAMDPSCAIDEHAFARLYRTKFELLQQAVRLSAREREEKRS